MAKNNRPSNIQHPLALGSLRNWLKLLWANGGVEPRFLPRAGFVSAGSVLTVPLRAYECIAYRMGQISSSRCASHKSTSGMIAQARSKKRQPPRTLDTKGFTEGNEGNKDPLGRVFGES